MIHLCYAFIRHFRAIENIGLKIDSRFDYLFNPDTNILHITENQTLPSAFWGTGVHSVAAIVGCNGAGKSTALSFLLESLVDGANKGTVNGVLVYDNDGILEVFGERVFVETPLTFKHITFIPKITCFYYSAHFLPYVSYKDLRSCELSGGYNASDNWLLVKDVESYTGINALQLNHSLSWHLNQFVAQNNYRICSMLADNRVKEGITGITLPKYIQFGINKSGYFALLDRIEGIKKLKEKGFPVTVDEENLTIPAEKNTHTKPRERFLDTLIFYNFLNFLNEDAGWKYNDAKETLNKWQIYKNDSDPILVQFLSFINSINVHRHELLSLHLILSSLNSDCHYYDDGISHFYYLEIEKDQDRLASLAKNPMADHMYLVGKVFDMYYSQGLKDTTILSSGEQQLLDLFSRLYDATILSPEKYANISSKRLILLDEAEIGFHPDLQRKYINMVIRFLNCLSVLDNQESFQVIISTHSPILLSDIPSCCITYLRRNKNNQIQDVSNSYHHGTFAANVFTQYRESFFLEDGLIGEFAEGIIRQVIDDLKNNRSLENAGKIIGIIGDHRIQAYLSSLHPLFGVDEQIAFYKRQIESLEQSRVNNNE